MDNEQIFDSLAFLANSKGGDFVKGSYDLRGDFGQDLRGKNEVFFGEEWKTEYKVASISDMMCKVQSGPSEF